MRSVTAAKRLRRPEGVARAPGDRQRIAKPAKPAKPGNVRGKSGEIARGAWCTPKHVAIAVGPFDVDPFSNPYSHIVSDVRCMLEDGGNGLHDPKVPGTWHEGASRRVGCAGADSRVWIQPPYSIVNRALDHYGHTRFTALLRFDPRVDWFKRLYRLSSLVCVFWEIEFEPPPGSGVTGGGNSFPHALFYRDASDVTDDVLRLCIAWKTRKHGT